MSAEIELYKTDITLGPIASLNAPGVSLYLRVSEIPTPELLAIRDRLAVILQHACRDFDTVNHYRGRLNTDDGLPGLFAELVLVLQQLCGAQVNDLEVLPESEPNTARVVVAKEDYESAFYAGELAVNIINSVISDSSAQLFDVAGELSAFLDFAAARALDINARLIQTAARKLGLPVFDLDQEPVVFTRPPSLISHGLLQVGICANQCRFLAGMSKHAAERLSPHVYRRQAVLQKLRSANLPVPRHDIESFNNNRFKRVLRAAQRIGFPVVLKQTASSAFGDASVVSKVIGPIEDANDLAQAFEAGFRSSSPAWVESYEAGAVFRFLVIRGQVVSVVRLDSPLIVGDGNRSVMALLDREAESEHLRAIAKGWRQIQADPLTSYRVRLQGWSMTAVPRLGAQVVLDFPGVAFTRRPVTEWVDCFDGVFPDLARRSAEILGLDFAGVDIIVRDLKGPATYPNCVIVGVRPEPDINIHALTGRAPGNLVADRLISVLFPSRDSAVVPVAAITGTNGKTTTTRMVASMFRNTGLRTGLACSDGVYIDDKLLESGDLAGAPGSLLLYTRTEIEALALETARGGLIKFGRPFERCDVGVCLNVAADHLGEHGIDNLDQLAIVKRSVIEHADMAVVLNAEDPRCLAMIPYASTQRVILFSGRMPRELCEHVTDGGEAVYAKFDTSGKFALYYHDGSVAKSLIAVSDIPATRHGKAHHNVENAAAALATGIGLGLPLDATVAALRQFEMSFGNTPSRLNEVPGLPYRILMDAAHNLHGLRALMNYLDLEQVSGKRVLVIGASSRFVEDEVREMARLIAPRFDLFLLKRYRPSEVHARCVEPWLVLRDELLDNGVDGSRIEIEMDARRAVAKGIARLDGGDLLVVLVPAGRSLEAGIWEEITRVARGRT